MIRPALLLDAALPASPRVRSAADASRFAQACADYSLLGDLLLLDPRGMTSPRDADPAVLAELQRRPCCVGVLSNPADGAAWLDAGTGGLVVAEADLPSFDDAGIPANRVIALLPLEIAQREQLAAAAERLGMRRAAVYADACSAADVAELDRLGVDVIVGPGVLRASPRLDDALIALLSSDRTDGLWPTVVVDELGVALGLAYSSDESLRAALAQRRGIYHSRTRGTWIKGETSGATQTLLRVDLDCDRDTLRFTVRQAGSGFCHRQTRTCWGADRGIFELGRTLAERAATDHAGSYTRRLLSDPDLLRAKLLEEAGELAAARTAEQVAAEAADVLYFTSVALQQAGVRLDDVSRELERRATRVTRRTGDAKLGVLPAPAAELARAASRAERLLRIVTPEQAAIRRAPAVDESTLQAAAEIVSAVRRRGESALREFAEQFGDIARGAPLIVERAELQAAFDRQTPTTRALLERVAGRIRRFAEAQRATLVEMETHVAGGSAGQRIQPVQRAGCYAPGGRYPLPSSVLMTVIPARVAGVAQVWVASPRPADVSLAAAAVAGADALLVCGGAHAIAALAYGAGQVPACDAVVGPGNRWVTAAKQLVAGQVTIDMLAGPSELLIVADDHADAACVAADLLAQAEHDPDALPMLLATSAALIDAVEHELAEQLPSLPSAEICRAALRNGWAACANDRAQLVALCDQIAPEHLHLHTRDAHALARELRCYGGLFVGSQSAEVLGDYGFGPNHTLPTGGTARRSGGLSVFTFLANRTWLRVDDASAAADATADVVALARFEQLEAHARSAERRLPNAPASQRVPRGVR